MTIKKVIGKFYRCTTFKSQWISQLKLAFVKLDFSTCLSKWSSVKKTISRLVGGDLRLVVYCHKMKTSEGWTMYFIDNSHLVNWTSESWIVYNSFFCSWLESVVVVIVVVVGAYKLVSWKICGLRSSYCGTKKFRRYPQINHILHFVEIIWFRFFLHFVRLFLR